MSIKVTSIIQTLIDAFLSKEHVMNKKHLQIAQDYRAGTLGKFDTTLMKLFSQADEFRRGKLSVSFPEEYQSWLIWFHESDMTIADLKEKRIANG